MQDDTQVRSGLISHSIEFYTSRLFIQGLVSGQFKRTSDVINRKESGFFSCTEASVTPLGRNTPPRKLSTPVLVGGEHIHFVASPPAGVQTNAERPTLSSGFGHENLVQKRSFPCYALTGTFVIRGFCHLHQGATLNSLLDLADPFIPLTQTRIYLISLPNATWQRDFAIINKRLLEAIYLTGPEQPPHQIA